APASGRRGRDRPRPQGRCRQGPGHRRADRGGDQARGGLRGLMGRVLITGAAKRFGRAIALDLARHGWDVVVHYNTSHSEARQTEAELRALGVDAKLVRCDLAREDEVATLVDRAGPLDALINNASIFEYDD